MIKIQEVTLFRSLTQRIEARRLASKKARLKDKARRKYTAYMDLFDEYDCGHRMLQNISVRACRLAREFDETYAELRKVCPEAPEPPVLSQ